MPTKQINSHPTAVTDLTTEIGVPTKSATKSFQVVVDIDPNLGDAQQAAVLAASKTVKVSVSVSNDRKNWVTLYPIKTITKAADAALATDYWDPTIAQMWGYHRAEISQVDTGVRAMVYMAMEGNQNS